MRVPAVGLGFVLTLGSSSVAWAQRELPPLPPGSSPAPGPASSASPATAPAPAPAPQPSAPAQSPAPPTAGTPSAPAYPPPVVSGESPPPPAYEYNEPPAPKHAPKYSLWLGGRLGLIAFGGNFYSDRYGTQSVPDSTGNFVKSGAAAEFDIGARLNRRFVPYVAFQYAALEAGHRFQGTDAKGFSTFVGLGFRYTLGNVDRAGFLADISLGFRSVGVERAGETFTMRSRELLRVGLGAEVRLSRRFVLSPLFVLSGGTMSDTDGNVKFAANQRDGMTEPRFNNGHSIDDQTNYLVVELACGAHFDLIGD